MQWSNETAQVAIGRQNSTQKTNEWAPRTPLSTWGCTGMFALIKFGMMDLLLHNNKSF
jgi:hypothetical protein